MSQGEELFGSIYERGEVVFSQGDPGETMYIIQSGAVEVSQRQGKRDVVLAVLERRDFFGEMALIDQSPRSATVKTIRRSRLLSLTRTSLLERLQQDPGVALHLLRALCRRIEEADRRLRTMVDADETLRLALENTREVVSEARPFSSDEFTSSPRKNDSSLPQAGMVHAVDIWPASREPVQFKSGDVIFRENEPGDMMYIITDGAVEISKWEGEHRCVLARLVAGDFFGEMALITSRPRTATASAIHGAKLLPIKRDDFFELVSTEPLLALYVLQVLIMRLRQKEAALQAPKESLDVLNRSLPPLLKKQGAIRVAFVSLSTCGGCSAVLLEDQDALADLIDRTTITYCPMLMDQGEIGEADVGVVDGAVRVWEDEEILKEARLKSRYLVAWGTCAAFGGIPALANQYQLEEVIETSYGQTLDPFSHYLSGSEWLERTAYQEKEVSLLRRAGKLDDFVRVDYTLPGCPPQLHMLTHLIKELRGEKQVLESRKVVCAECGRKPAKIPIEDFRVFPEPDWAPGHCFASRGALCMGFVTKGGCGAVCPRNGLPCWGCRGPSEAALKKIGNGYSFEQVLLSALARRSLLNEKQIKPVIRAVRKQGNSSLNFDHNFVSIQSRLR
jgi:F420-non-reducing hydrogenase small subunit